MENEKNITDQAERVDDKFMIRAFPKVTRRSSDDKRTTVVITTDGGDRHGTIIDPNGGVLDNYRQNPVFLINHDYDLLAGSGAELTVQNNQIVANIDDDMWDLEDERILPYYNKVKKGIMRSASIGFKPLKVEYEDEEGKPLDMPIIRKWELLEFSFVTVGSDPQALVTVRNYSKEKKEFTAQYKKDIKEIRESIEELRDSHIDLNKLSDLVKERLVQQPQEETVSQIREDKETASYSTVDWEKLKRDTITQTTNQILKGLGKK